MRSKQVKGILEELRATAVTPEDVPDDVERGHKDTSKNNADRYNVSVFALLAYDVEPMWCYPTPGPASGSVLTTVAYDGQVTYTYRLGVDAIRTCLEHNLALLEELEEAGATPSHTDEALHTLAAALHNRLHSYMMTTWHTGVHDPPRLVALFNRERIRLIAASAGNDGDSRASDESADAC